MLNIALSDNKRFIVQLDQDHPQYERAYILVRSLLTSFEVKPHEWVMNYDDVLWLKEKLNESGLRDVGKTITLEASEWLTYLNKCEAYNVWLKDGGKNEETRHLLRGQLKHDLYEDQLTAVSYLLENKRVGLFDSMGAGKSLISLATFIGLGLKKLLVVCPKGVIPGFARDVVKHTHLKAVALPAGRKTALKYLKNNAKGDWDVLFVHPENLVGTKNNKFGPVLLSLLDLRWDMIIVDEFHKFKNIGAKRSQCVVRLLTEARDASGGVSRALPMTGTPISESPTNAYVFLKLSNYGKLPHVMRFENYFTVKQTVDYGAKGSHSKIVGYKNLDFLKVMLERRSIRRTKKDLKGFPEKIFMTRDIYLTGRQEALYKAFKGELLASLPQTSKLNLVKILESNSAAIRMRQCLNHPSFLDEPGESAKFEELDSMLEELFTDPEAKAIVWTEYRHGVDLLYDYFNEKWGVVKVYGGVDIDDALIDRFEGGDRPRVAAAIPAKGGEGLDFLARARTAFYIDRPYSFTLYSQSLDRIHRRVSTSKNMTTVERIRAQPATIIFMDAVGTIDEWVRMLLGNKEDLAEALLTSDEQLIEVGKAELIKMLR